jgi:predicted amidohydrolase YtcJ
MTRRLSLCALFGLAAMVAAAPILLERLQAQQPPGIDIILTNGKIVTVDDQFRIAQAVAVRGDRIAAVGSNAEITKLAGPGTRRIDLRGRTVLPGMIDNHAHFQEEGAYWTMELRFDGVDTRKRALELIAAKAKATPNNGWVYVLGGWSPDQFTDDKREFTREELDKVAPNNPVFLQFTRWAQYLNSKAIEVLGLDKMTEPWIEASRASRGAISCSTRPRSSTSRTAARPTCRWSRSPETRN